MLSEKRVNVVGPSVQYHVNVVIPRRPWIAKQFTGFSFERCGDCVPQPVQRLPQRSAPLLVPVRIPTGIAAAVAVPALHAVRTTPRGTFPDFCFISRWMPLEIFAVVGDRCEFVAFDVM